MKWKNIVTVLCSIFMFLIITAGCGDINLNSNDNDNGTEGVETNKDNLSSLSVNLKFKTASDYGYSISKVTSKITKGTFTKEIELTIDNESQSATGKFEKLAIGEYNIEIKAYDGDTQIAEGSGTATIEKGQEATAEITLEYFTGDLVIDINFDDGKSNEIPTEGLVAYYPFNGNANDESGNGNNGTVNGATLITDRFGNADSSYSFDGVNDYVSVADNDIFTLGTNPFTMSVWVNFNQVKGRSPFIGHDESGGRYNKWIFWYDASGHDKPSGPALRFHITSPFLSPIDPAYSPWEPNTGQWYHAVVIRDGNTYTLYMDNVKISTNTNSNSIPNPNTTLTIGKAEAYSFNGLIDDIRIYNRALSGAEVQALFNE